mgnify:CR=1 FL=1
MSEKMTVITLMGESRGAGFMDYGEVSAEKMIQEYRAIAKEKKRAAEQILAAKDEDFRIVVQRGKIVGHHIKTLQPGRSNRDAI